MQNAVIFRFQKDAKWMACWEPNGLNCLRRKNSPWQKYALYLAAYYLEIQTDRNGNLSRKI